MTKNRKLNNFSRVAVLAHVLTSVPVADLERYLLNLNTDVLLFIHHPLQKRDVGSSYKLFRKSKLKSKAVFHGPTLPQLLSYFQDIFLSLIWLTKPRVHWDVIIALDNLNTLAALILRHLGIVRRVVYYSIDYVPVRFKNTLLNELYHKIDDFCAIHADYVWNVSPRIIEARQEIRKISSTQSNQLVVPIGIWLEKFEFLPYSEINPHHIVYAGGLMPHQGIQIFLMAMPDILKKIPTVELSIIGLGEYENELKDLTEKLNLTKSVRFLGYFENHDTVAKMCSHFGLAIALYSSELDIWSRYADPSKMKTYLAAGLPIITTDVTFFSKTIQEKNCGVIVNSNSTLDIQRAVETIISSSKKHEIFRKNARKLASEFKWEDIFLRAFEKIN